MKAYFKSVFTVMAIMVLALGVADTAMAATNTAIDGGGGGILLGNSNTVTVTSTQLALIKAVYDSAGNCIASSDSDLACGSTSSVSVLTGTRLTFVIYVNNSTAIAANDIRIQDNISDAAPDYFQFQTDTWAPLQGISYGTRASAGANKANIYTAARTNPLTNALDGGTPGEFAGIDTSGNPDVLTAGGTGIAGSNAQVDVPANTIWAVAFDVIKLD